MHNPFAESIGLVFEEERAGYSRCSLTLAPAQHHNPHQVVHGAVLYTLADTGMGVALYPTLAEREICATIEIKINYFRTVSAGTITCITEMLNRGRTIANLESRLFHDGRLIAQANGNYAIFLPRNAG
ncbi:MAG: PaaI family thioesterase [Ideonella sp.]|nr:PaaI family thioesterase [Ideonella sp.]MCC7459417.1 PaaI family thioesterase [Nitrospira sp.]